MSSTHVFLWTSPEGEKERSLERQARHEFLARLHPKNTWDWQLEKVLEAVEIQPDSHNISKTGLGVGSYPQILTIMNSACILGRVCPLDMGNTAFGPEEEGASQEDSCHNGEIQN